MSENVSKSLSSSQRKAADVLLRGGSKQKAAEAAGVTVRTIDRYLQDESFSRYLRDGSAKALQTAAMRIASLMELALQVLYECMTDPGPKAHIKLRSANYTLTHALKMLEVTDLVARMEALEEHLGIRH